MRYLKNGGAKAIRTVRAAGIEARVTAHSGRVGLAARTDGARRVHHGSHAGRQLENRPHGRALLGRRDRRTRGRQKVSVKAGTGGRHDSKTASIEPHSGMKFPLAGDRVPHLKTTSKPYQNHITQENCPSKASRGSLRSSGAPRLGSRASRLAWRPARPTGPQYAARRTRRPLSRWAGSVRGRSVRRLALRVCRRRLAACSLRQ